MAFEIIFRRNGKDVETDTDHSQDKETAIAAAGVGFIFREAESVRIRDLSGSSAEICSVTDAGVHPNVSALVYVAARAPDAGEDYMASRPRGS
jgi:hypothetical protein